jgi:hypothetical protein
MPAAVINRNVSYVLLLRPAIIKPAPPKINTALMIGETRSLCLVWMPMFTSPALMPWFSLCGIGTKSDAIPRINKIRPTNIKVFIEASCV